MRRAVPPLLRIVGLIMLPTALILAGVAIAFAPLAAITGIGCIKFADHLNRIRW